MRNITEAQKLYDTIIKNGYCIGCGVCASFVHSPFTMGWDDVGMIQAQPKQNLSESKLSVLAFCPFSTESLSEDQLSNMVFNDEMESDPSIGKYINCYVASTNDEAIRSRASSGGVGRWLAGKLLSQGIADYFIHVESNNKTSGDPRLFKYTISSDKASVYNTSKSAYYPVTLDEVISKVRVTPGSYVITGVPCFIKSIRLLSMEDTIIRQRIKYSIGIVCGSLKTNQYASCIAWEQGVHPDSLIAIDFRKKFTDRPANHKGNEVVSKNGKTSKVKSSKELFTTNYGMGFFKPKACDYCDDVVAELADISIGDAWLPEYVKDPRGNSIVIIREKAIDTLINQGAKDGEISLTPISKDKIIQSQAGGFRHRREGLSYRLYKKATNNEFVPAKRVNPSKKGLSKQRQLVYDLREEISIESQISFHKALKNNSIELFYQEMTPLVVRYKQANQGKLYRKIIRKIKQIILNKLKIW